MHCGEEPSCEGQPTGSVTNNHGPDISGSSRNTSAHSLPVATSNTLSNL